MEENNKKENKWFIFKEDHILLRIKEKTHFLVSEEDFCKLNKYVGETYYITSDDKSNYNVALLDSYSETEGFELVRFRKSFYTLEESNFLLAAKAYQTIYWHHSHKYCGKCGNKTALKETEVARECTVCGFTYYPQQAPAVIVSVRRGNEILLARSDRFPTAMYSVLAGFVDPGESLEDCVRREIWEETRIRVKNIKYFGSQPWPFPNSLMIAFTAEYESGEIIIDGEEIVAADWYKYDALPKIPDEISIAGRLIKSFVDSVQ